MKQLTSLVEVTTRVSTIGCPDAKNNKFSVHIMNFR